MSWSLSTPNRDRGFALVVVILLAFLGAVGLVLSVYGRSYSSFERGSNRVGLFEQARLARQQLGSVVRTAQPAGPAKDALVRPAVTDRSPSPELVFYSPESLLQDFGAGFYKVVRRELEDGQGVLVLEDQSGSYSRILAERLESCEFLRPDRGTVEARIRFSQEPHRLDQRILVVLPEYIDGP